MVKIVYFHLIYGEKWCIVVVRCFRVGSLCPKCGVETPD